MRRMRWLIAAAVVIALAASGYFVYKSRQDAARAQQAQGRQVTVKRSTLVAAVSASGSIAPETQVTLNFQTPGVVDKVNVVVGQKVKAGDTLALLDTSDLALAVQQAEQTLLIQQVNYSQTLAGPKTYDVAAAQAQLGSAWAQYNDMKTPKDTTVSQALANLKKAEADLKQAQDAYNGVVEGRDTAKSYGVKGGGLGRAEEQMRQQLAAVQAAYDAALVNYNQVVKGSTDAQLRTAWSQVQQAQTNLDRLKPDADKITVSKAQMEQARIAYEQARLRLDHASIVAPFDGTVSQVNITRGGNAPTGPLGALVLVDDSRFHIDVTVDEIDIAKLKVGQAVNVSVDALGDTAITGKVARISPVATTQAGVVSYDVRIALDKTDAPLLAGMSANAAIVTATRENVIVVPNWAIRIDRATGKMYVTRQVGNQFQEVQVKTGLRNENDSEVLSGVQEGDVLIVGGVTSLGSIINEATK